MICYQYLLLKSDVDSKNIIRYQYEKSYDFEINLKFIVYKIPNLIYLMMFQVGFFYRIKKNV